MYIYMYIYIYIYILYIYIQIYITVYRYTLHEIIWHMGWLRLVGSLKLQVSFAKEPYKRDDILQKRPIILRSLLNVATPYDLMQGATQRLHMCYKNIYIYVYIYRFMSWFIGIHCMGSCVPWRLHVGWLRSVGSIKIQVSIAEYRLFYRSLLQKRPII